MSYTLSSYLLHYNQQAHLVRIMQKAYCGGVLVIWSQTFYILALIGAIGQVMSLQSIYKGSVDLPLVLSFIYSSKLSQALFTMILVISVQ